jgi:putative chitinase
MSFKFNFTKKHVALLFPRHKNVDALYKALYEVLPKYEINTVDRVAGFLAQCGHESMGFTALKENLNYSAKALDAVFGKYFKRAGRDANAYARQPEKIANIVYANRMGNGSEASGDGWKYRGRGAIQLTGKDNYTSFAKSIDKSLDETIAYLETMDGAIESACWFWKSRKLNEYCDKRDIVTLTKRINGGTNGLADRKAHYDKALKVLGSN